MKIPYLLLFLVCLAVSSPSFFSNSPTPAGTELSNQIAAVLSLIGPFMLMMIILAAAAYVGSQLFGSETRAKATVWAQGMIVAVAICAVLLLLFYTVLPGFFTNNLFLFDLTTKITELRDIAEDSFGIFILTLLVLSATAYVIGQTSGAETRAKALQWANNLLAGAIVGAALYLVIFDIITPFQYSLFNEPLSGGITIGAYGAVLIDVSILVSIIILATYIISQFFKIPEWEAYLNIEMSNLLGTFILFIFIVGMFVTTEGIAKSFYDSANYSTAPEAAIAFMSQNVSTSALQASLDVFTIQTCASMLSTFSKRTGEFVLTQTYKVFPGMDTFVSATNVLTYTLVALYSTIVVQTAFLHLIDGLMVPFVLPAGLLLRFFPPTRDAGAFLISLAFGFQLIYPTFYLINATIYYDLGGENYKSPTATLYSFCGLKYPAAGALFNPNANPIFAFKGLTSLGTMLGKIVSEGFINATSMAQFTPIIENIASMSLLVIFMPALAMLVTISFINVMTKFILTKG